MTNISDIHIEKKHLLMVAFVTLGVVLTVLSVLNDSVTMAWAAGGVTVGGAVGWR